ncbi:hypothetical protein CVV38_03245 [Candidatus Peregrinibacteria bacterium HGW-Peregrinibacteria-1]|jgi:FkbM family methyltransferase|nr:MAG: hypothetical protein CVV38_03245 [Candidatus Peregrinibacteria bacterium HGW-Peregrinibacteria-1]
MLKKTFKLRGKDFHFSLRDDADESVFDEIFIDEDYSLCKQYLQGVNNGFVLDIGGHVGLFSLWAWGLNSGLRVCAYEPSLENVQSFKNHLRLNKVEGVVVKNKAVGAVQGVRELFYGADNINHSLLIEGAAGSVKVEVDAFNDVLAKYIGLYGKIDLVKFDAEGVEFEVLEAIDSGVFANVEAIIMEYHLNSPNSRGKDWIVSRIKSAGFTVSCVPSKYSNDLGMIWARRS